MVMHVKYTEQNKKAINSWAKDGWIWSEPISHEEYLKAVNGEMKILMTPTKFLPREYLPIDLKEKEVLGLAAGGGQQIPVLAAMGAKVTVLDFSELQIEDELMVAKREGYTVNAICRDMTDKLPFDDESFDIIINPVSMCYIEDCFSVFKECYRILKPGGIMISGHDNGICYMAWDYKTITEKMPFNPLIYPRHKALLEEENGGLQFSHSLSDIIGSILKCGFTITDIYEDTDSDGYLHDLNINTFYTLRYIKK